MKLIAVRHGETVWNTERRKTGQTDSPLTAIGRRQSEAVARRLEALEFAALYSSDLGRAVETAKVIAARYRIEVVLKDKLRERNFGIFEGLSRDEIRERFSRERKQYKRDKFGYVIPDGESDLQTRERCVAALTSIAEKHSNQNVVVVTHGYFLKCFFESILGLAPGNIRRCKSHNASYNVFNYSDGKWALETWNNIGHLNGIVTS